MLDLLIKDTGSLKLMWTNNYSLETDIDGFIVFDAHYLPFNDLESTVQAVETESIDLSDLPEMSYTDIYCRGNINNQQFILRICRVSTVAFIYIKINGVVYSISNSAYGNSYYVEKFCTQVTEDERMSELKRRARLDTQEKINEACFRLIAKGFVRYKVGIYNHTYIIVCDSDENVGAYLYMNGDLWAVEYKEEFNIWFSNAELIDMYKMLEEMIKLRISVIKLKSALCDQIGVVTRSVVSSRCDLFLFQPDKFTYDWYRSADGLPFVQLVESSVKDLNRLVKYYEKNTCYDVKTSGYYYTMMDIVLGGEKCDSCEDVAEE